MSDPLEQPGPEIDSGLRLPERKQKKSSKGDAGSEAAVTKRPRWHAFLSGAILIVLIAAVAIELRAQSSFHKHLRICQSALERGEGKTGEPTQKVAYDELKKQFSVQPVYSIGIRSFAPSGIYTWTWQGIRPYKLRLFVDLKSGTVWDVDSEP